MNKAIMNLQLFGEEGAAAPAAMAAPAAENGTTAVTEEAAPISSGDTLADGTKVASTRVADAMNRQMQRHPELRKVYGRQGAAQPRPTAAQPAAPQQGGEAAPDGAPSIEERWETLRKGEFKELYSRDVQNAVKDRFKNQDDATAKLVAIQPMLDALKKKAGVETVEELQKLVLDDDSLYEEEAEKMGMSVGAYRQFKQLQDEHDAAVKAQERSQQEIQFRQHISGLVQQAEKLKAQFPSLNIYEELKNPTFQRLTSPGVGLSVEDAYFAVHRNELAPQLMGYGMKKARQQMSQTIQAQAARPAEGAMRTTANAADVKLDPRKMSRAERDAIRDMVHRNRKKVTFD